MSPVEGNLPTAQDVAKGKLLPVHHGGFLSTGTLGTHHWITTCQKVVCDRRLAFLRNLDHESDVSRKRGYVRFDPNGSNVQYGITSLVFIPNL